MDPDREKLIEDLYQRVLDLPPDRREQLLSDECAGDADLREEVEALLRHGDAAPSQFLAGVADPIVDDASEILLLDGMVGRTVGRYKLLRVIASGGMGTVYEAQQEQPNRTVAVKLVRQGLRSSAAVRRFQYESEVLGHLSHPGIAQVFESGVHREPGGAVPYFAMEYVSGAVSITEYATAQILGINDRVRLFLRVSDAVQYSHQRAVIHRDLKPANVLVTPDGQPKIIDFGVARVLSSDVSMASAQTQTGQMLGTLRYMSPEQCGPTPADIDARTDVYALGVILFELLTEQLPYDLGSTSPFDAPQVIRETAPTRPSAISTAVSGDLEVVLLKALEKDREQRYQSAVEFARDLQRVLTSEPIEAKRGSQWYVLRKTLSRHKTAVATVVMLFSVVSVCAIVMTVLYREARQQEQNARHNLELAAKEAITARTTVDFLTELFEVADPLADSPASGADFTARDILERGAAKLREGLSDEPEVRAALLTAIGRVYLNLGQFKLGIGQLEEAVRIRERVDGPQHPDVAESLTWLARIQIEQARYDIAEQHLSRALAIYRSSDLVADADMADTLTTLGSLKYQSGDAMAAEPLFREALAIRERIFGERHPRVGESLNDLALIMHATERFEEGERLYRQSIDLQKSVLGSDHVAVATTMQNFAGMLHHTKDYERAAVLFEEAIRIKRMNLGNEHPSVANSLNNFGAMLHDMGEYDRAEMIYREALTIRRAAFREGHPSIAQSLNNIGELLMIRDRPDEAAPLFDEAWSIRREAYGDEHEETLRSFVDIGWAHRARGDLALAEPYYTKTLEVRQRTLGPDHPSTKLVRGQLEALRRERERQGIDNAGGH